MSHSPSETSSSIESSLNLQKRINKRLENELTAANTKLKVTLEKAQQLKLQHDQIVLNEVNKSCEIVRNEYEEKISQLKSEFQNTEQRHNRLAESEQSEKIRQLEENINSKYLEKYEQLNGSYEIQITELKNNLVREEKSFHDLKNKYDQQTEYMKELSMEIAKWADERRRFITEIEIGKEAQINLLQYRKLLKYMTVSKFVKDSKLKRQLIPLHHSMILLIQQLMNDEEIKKKLSEQNELFRWYEEAIIINQNNKLYQNSTKLNFIVSSLQEVEHVLIVCLQTLLELNEHFKRTSAGFFERNLNLTNYSITIEKDIDNYKNKINKLNHKIHDLNDQVNSIQSKNSQLTKRLEDKKHHQHQINDSGVITSITRNTPNPSTIKEQQTQQYQQNLINNSQSTTSLYSSQKHLNNHNSSQNNNNNNKSQNNVSITTSDSNHSIPSVSSKHTRSTKSIHPDAKKGRPLSSPILRSGRNRRNEFDHRDKEIFGFYAPYANHYLGDTFVQTEKQDKELKKNPIPKNNFSVEEIIKQLKQSSNLRNQESSTNNINNFNNQQNLHKLSNKSSNTNNSEFDNEPIEMNERFVKKVVGHEPPKSPNRLRGMQFWDKHSIPMSPKPNQSQQNIKTANVPSTTTSTSSVETSADQTATNTNLDSVNENAASSTVDSPSPQEDNQYASDFDDPIEQHRKSVDTTSTHGTFVATSYSPSHDRSQTPISPRQQHHRPSTASTTRSIQSKPVVQSKTFDWNTNSSSEYTAAEPFAVAISPRGITSCRPSFPGHFRQQSPYAIVQQRELINKHNRNRSITPRTTSITSFVTKKQAKVHILGGQAPSSTTNAPT